MPNVVFTIDCEGAHHDRCYTPDYIKVFEAEFVPATWLVHVSLGPQREYEFVLSRVRAQDSQLA